MFVLTISLSSLAEIIPFFATTLIVTFQIDQAGLPGLIFPGP